jgi:hypothetical protein
VTEETPIKNDLRKQERDNLCRMIAQTGAKTGMKSSDAFSWIVSFRYAKNTEPD